MTRDLNRFTRMLALPAALIAAAVLPNAAFAADNGKFRIGVVSFLSGSAAGPFGVPAANAAKLVVEAIKVGS